jgi:hypothetical protein
MLNQGSDGGWASKPHSMVKRGHSVLVRRVDVRPGLEQGDKPPPLVGVVGILFGADFGQFVNGAHRLSFTGDALFILPVTQQLEAGIARDSQVVEARRP